MSQAASNRTVWILKKGSEKKFRFGHPWVFSSELAQSPKSVEPGGIVELRDFSGNFLALGYGHPNSMISFRTLSLQNVDAIDSDFLIAKLKAAQRLRTSAGLEGFSHRMVFAEGDYLPGFVVDRFYLEENGQVFVVQASTAGADRMLPQMIDALEQISGDLWQKTAIVVANDSKSRALEGLQSEPKKLVKTFESFDPEKAQILLQPALAGVGPVRFEVDFINGQKTGFFLDQRLNVQLSAKPVYELALAAARENRTLKILDLFCYVGQWGGQLAHTASSAGAKVEVTLVDASQRALDLAIKNVESQRGQAKALKSDVVEEISKMERASYDIVICDPPAFVKKKKDLPTGGPAYYKVNREALKRVRSGGLFVSCSCSGLFGEEEFRSMLAKVTSTAERRVRWIARGSHSPDHPQRPEFPQGTYLKSWIGLVE